MPTAMLPGDVHALAPIGGRRRKKKMRKAEPRSLYVNRPVTNAAALIAWAKGAGFETTLPASDMHVTLAFSRTPVDWDLIEPDEGTHVIPPNMARQVEQLGDKGAMVLRFDSIVLENRWAELKEAGAVWDFPSFKPHATISYNAGGIDLSAIGAYQGEIVLGPERFAEVEDDWQSGITEKALGAFRTDAQICKVDESLGLVFGFAVVCKDAGAEYFDSQGDHIPEDAMLKAAADFMVNSRVAKEMHEGEKVGDVVFAFPLTTDIAKALDITTPKTGLLIAIQPGAAALAKFRSGEYTGFSIGGRRIRDEEVTA